MGTIYQRKPGGTYYGYWTDSQNRHHRKTLSTRDPQVARVRLRQLELVSTDPATYARHSLGAAIKHLLDVVSQGNAPATWKAYRQKAENLIDGIGDVELSTVTRDVVLAYVQRRRMARSGRKDAKIMDGTIHKELVVLRRALAEARERGLWKGEPRSVVPSIRVRYEPRERWLDVSQLQLVLAELSAERRLWVALAALGGLCLSEVERLEWTHIDLQRATMRVPGTKRRDRWRVVPLHSALLAMLKSARQASGRVVSHWGNVRRDLGIAIQRANERAAEGRRKPPPPIPRVSPNDLRRTFASWLKQQGVDSLAVAHLLGHSSTRMVDLVYGRLSEDTYRAAIAKMPRVRLGEQRVRKPGRDS